MTGRPDETLASLLDEYARSRAATARDEVVLASMDLVDHIAQRYRFAGEPLEDLVQEGTIGLINAVEMFDPTRGVKFTTYASHAVQGAIQHYLRDKGKLIREPGWLHDLNQKINKARSRLHHVLGREPSVTEIASDLQIPEQQVDETVRTRGVFRVSSLEQPQTEEGDGGYSFGERERPAGDKADALDVPVVERLAIEDALGQLRAAERQVVYDFFFNDLSKTEIGRKMGYSSSHVAHLLRRALKQLKDHLITDERSLVRRQLRSLEGQLADYELRLEEESIRDDLTGLFNRRYLLDRLDEEISRSRRYSHQLSVVLAEVVGLGAFAERHGEAEVDHVLCTLAHLLTAASRRIDRIGRYDERRFMMVLPHTGAQAVVLANRLREMADEHGFGAVDESLPLRVASGIAVFPECGATADEMIRAAYQALESAATQPDLVRVHPLAE